MRITERKYLAAYFQSIGNEIPRLIRNYDFSENIRGLDYLTKSSAVYSSNIEGNSIDLNSYMNYELNKDKFKVGKEIEEIEDYELDDLFWGNQPDKDKLNVTLKKILESIEKIKSIPIENRKYDF